MMILNSHKVFTLIHNNGNHSPEAHRPWSRDETQEMRFQPFYTQNKWQSIGTSLKLGSYVNKNRVSSGLHKGSARPVAQLLN